MKPFKKPFNKRKKLSQDSDHDPNEEVDEKKILVNYPTLLKRMRKHSQFCFAMIQKASSTKTFIKNLEYVHEEQIKSFKRKGCFIENSSERISELENDILKLKVGVESLERIIEDLLKNIEQLSSLYKNNIKDSTSNVFASNKISVNFPQGLRSFLNPTKSSSGLDILISAAKFVENKDFLPTPSRQNIPKQFSAIYTIGGQIGNEDKASNKITIFDPTRELFVLDSTLNISRKDFCAAVSEDSRIYMVGGKDHQNCHIRWGEIFDMNLGFSNSAIQPMLFSRTLSSCSFVSKSLFVCGGLDEDGKRTSTVQTYNTERNEWFSYPKMKKERSDFQVITHGDTIYAIGGMRSVFAERFDVRENIWQNLNAHYAVQQTCSAVLHNDLIYTCNEDTFSTYDIVASKWRNLPNPEKFIFGAKLVCFGDKIYRIGGFQNNVPTSDISVYDIKGQIWFRIQNLFSVAHASHVSLLGHINF